jgi:hypothetical protein
MTGEALPVSGQRLKSEQVHEIGRCALGRDGARPSRRANVEDCGSHLCASFVDRWY